MHPRCHRRAIVLGLALWGGSGFVLHAAAVADPAAAVADAPRKATGDTDHAPFSLGLNAPPGLRLRAGPEPAGEPSDGRSGDADPATGRDEALAPPTGLSSLSATPGEGLASTLRRLGAGAAQPTDITMQIKPDSASRLKIRLYASGSGGAGRNDLVSDAPPGAEAPARRTGVDPSNPWWAVQTRLTNERLQGHRLLFGSDLQVAPAGSGGASDGGAVAADHRHTLFVEDRTRLWPDLSVSAGVRQDWVDSAMGDASPWVLLETKVQDDLAVRYAHGDVYRPTGAVAVPGQPSAAAAAAAGGARAQGHSIAIEHQPAPGRRWTVAAFDNPAHAPGLDGPTAIDRLLMQGAATVPHNRGVRVAAAQSLPDGTTLSVDYLAQATASGGGASPPAATADNVAVYGRLAAALPLDGHWKIGTETVMVGRYGATAGYGMTHLVLVGNAPNDRSTLSLHVYDLLDRHPVDTTVGSVLQPVFGSSGALQQDGRGMRLDVGIPF